MKLNNKLGICIPTYKRPDQLLKCVTSIIEAGQSYGISIFISDDSTDDTNKKAIEELQNKYSNIVVNYNVENLGIDKNIVKSIDMCTCEFAWPLGEDDWLTKNAIELVLQALEKEKNLPFLFVNYSYVNNDFSRILMRKRLNFKSNTLISGNEFFEKYIWSAGFIGGCIISKSDWSKISVEKYIGTYFAHVGAISEIIKDKSILIISEALVLNRAENASTSTWSDKAFDVFYGWEYMILMLKEFYSKESIEKSLKSSNILFKHRSLAWLASKRADGIYDIKIYARYIHNENFSKNYKLTAKFIAKLPIFPFKVAKVIYIDLPRIFKSEKIS